MASSRRVHLLWGLALTTLVILSVKFFVADVYQVDSGSMLPALDGGVDLLDGKSRSENVLVVYERNPELHRFDLVVVDPRTGADPIVKRVGGLPGETILITAGDLLVNGRRLPMDAPRPAPVLLFDDAVLPVEEFFLYSEDGSWKQEGDQWWLDASTVDPGADRGLMLFHKDLKDGYLGADGQRRPGTVQVNDGVFECEVFLEEAAGRLRFELRERGDTFTVVIEPEAGVPDRFRILLGRRNSGTIREQPGGQEILLNEEIPFRVGEWHAVRFANVDNHLLFDLDHGDFTIERSYEANKNHPAPFVREGESIGHRLGFGGEGLRARFRSIRVLRDLFYTENGTHGVRAPLTLGPYEYFLLGDNSAHSTDSREFGPVKASAIIGHPWAVVWPLARARRLYGAAPR